MARVATLWPGGMSLVTRRSPSSGRRVPGSTWWRAITTSSLACKRIVGERPSKPWSVTTVVFSSYMCTIKCSFPRLLPSPSYADTDAVRRAFLDVVSTLAHDAVLAAPQLLGVLVAQRLRQQGWRKVLVAD